MLWYPPMQIDSITGMLSGAVGIEAAVLDTIENGVEWFELSPYIVVEAEDSAKVAYP